MKRCIFLLLTLLLLLIAATPVLCAWRTQAQFVLNGDLKVNKMLSWHATGTYFVDYEEDSDNFFIKE
ncbi:hypothetical protein ACFL0Z_02965 [Patescibacteria group bacterium]